MIKRKMRVTLNILKFNELKNKKLSATNSICRILLQNFTVLKLFVYIAILLYNYYILDDPLIL